MHSGYVKTGCFKPTAIPIYKNPAGPRRVSPPGESGRLSPPAQRCGRAPDPGRPPPAQPVSPAATSAAPKGRARNQPRSRTAFNPTRAPQRPPLTDELLVNTQGKAGHLRVRPSHRLGNLQRSENDRRSPEMQGLGQNGGGGADCSAGRGGGGLASPRCPGLGGRGTPPSLAPPAG